jgi:6-phosphofructo-2-kinase/fructose-2,6-biphosphatase 2
MFSLPLYMASAPPPPSPDIISKNFSGSHPPKDNMMLLNARQLALWIETENQICLVMVGLPARGKSLISGKVKRYLGWTSVDAKIFNVGMYRREATPHPDASFFQANNPDGEKARRAAAEAAVDDMLNWFKDKSHKVAILDATNSTKSRRKWINEKVVAAKILPLFVESKCDDERIITQNILEVKTTSPDYKGQDPEEAVRDFRDRIKNYEAVYETIDESERHFTYVKITNIGHQVIINQIQDYLQSRLVYYLTNLHIKPRSIWLSRHGESEYNLEGKIGGDASISERGERYARMLPELVRRSGVPKDQPLTIWTSTLKRTNQTARHLVAEMGWEKLDWKALDELDSGVCDGMTYQEIAEKYPEDFSARDDDKYNYRYRGGESYRDVVIRLEPIIMELERAENILIITHQAVVRCIYAYFMDLPQTKSPWMEVPLHTLMKLTPKAYGTHEERFKADIPAVSTWRSKGSVAKHHDSISGASGIPTITVGSPANG